MAKKIDDSANTFKIEYDCVIYDTILNCASLLFFVGFSLLAYAFVILVCLVLFVVF